MSDALLRFENVTKSYGDFTVFSDISLEVHEKEVVSIIGSSGSGKTTLLRCINLLEPFEAGKIILDGQEIGYHDVNGKRKRVPEKVIAQQRSMTGMVFQQFNLFPHMTAKKNVMLGLTHTKKMPKAEAEALAEQQLAELEQTQLGQAEVLERVLTGTVDGNVFLLRGHYLVLEDAALERQFEVNQ